VIVSVPSIPFAAWLPPAGCSTEHQNTYVPGANPLTVKATVWFAATCGVAASAWPADAAIPVERDAVADQHHVVGASLELLGTFESMNTTVPAFAETWSGS
jgi:hypothetical protein